MKKISLNKKGFTITEVLFVAVVSGFVIATILSTWIFTHKVWSGEKHHTMMRVDMLKAIENIKADMRLSSSGYMSYYPLASGSYTAVSMPRADADINGFYTLDSDNKIDWDKTVVYHIVEDEYGRHLRRTVIDSWNSSLDEDERYAILEDVVDGSVTGDSSSDLVKDNLDHFEILPLSPVVDFYTDSAMAVEEKDVTFGYAEIASGDYDLRFTVTGKNDDSSGYAFGIDNIKIQPAGGNREAEYYNSSFASAGAISSNGKTITLVHGTVWDNDNYLEYAATEVADYLEFADYYDLWRDSAFDDASLNNVLLTGNELYARLELPEDRVAMLKEDIAWDAFDEADDSTEEGQDGDLPGYPITVRTIVTNAKIDTEDVISSDPVRGNLVRVKFVSSSDNPFKIQAAYITRRNGQSGMDGVANQSSSGLEIEEYHRHQQLFFQDVNDGNGINGTDEILPEAYIAKGSYVWSEWIGFPLAIEDGSSNEYDYFITFGVPDLDVIDSIGGDTFSPSGKDVTCWEPDTGTTVHTYYIQFLSCTLDYTTDTFTTATAHGFSNNDEIAFGGNTMPTGISSGPADPADIAGRPDWTSWQVTNFYYARNVTTDTFQISTISGGLPIDFINNGSDVIVTGNLDASGCLDPSSDFNVYVSAEIDSWKKTGSVESKIFNTQLSNPVYNKIKWSEDVPFGTEVLMKTRVSSDSGMSGATAWSLITGSGGNPHSLSLGTDQYIQYRAEISTEPYWEWSSGTLTYSAYVDEQSGGSNVYDFPARSGAPVLAAVDAAWIDDVEIDWPGGKRICVIKGDIVRKNDYGQVSVSLNGNDLVKVLEVDIGVSKEYEGRTFTEENTFQIESRNTMK